MDLDLVELDVAVLGEQRLVGVQTGLGLAAARRGVHPHPLQLLLDRALAVGLLTLLLGEADLLLLQPARIVALVGNAAATVELEDPPGDVVQEVAIVGDGDDRARVVTQVLLQPGDRLGVEVVGGLVEQQEIGLAQQQPAQRDAAALTAGERGDVGVGGGAAERVHRVLERRVEIPPVDRIDLLLDARELVCGLVGVVHRQLVEAVEQGPDLGDPVLDVPLDVLGRIQIGLLRQQADGRLGRQLGLAAELGVDSRHDLQQARLAGAVVAEHADLGARIERQRDVGEDLLVRRMAPAELVRREDVLSGHCL